ncbi:MAG TPA: WD40 repeat domain-containing protein [Verrucomicrobiae bacterium]
MFSRERHAYAQAVVAEGRAIASEHQQSALRVEESKAKAAAQQSLYASLLGQARAIRLARHPGYRQEVFPLIEEAKALDVPEKNLDDLRRETVACLGDFVGLTPAIFTNFPTTLSAAILDPSGKLALFCLNDGTQSLREVSSDKEIARPQGLANGVWGFNSRGNELFNFGGESNAWRARAWSLNATAHWEERTDFPLPGSPRLMLSSDEDMFTLIYAHNYAQSGNSITLSLFNLSRQSFVEGHDLTVGWPRHGQGYLTATPDARLVAVETVDRDKPNSSAMLAFYDWSSDKPLHQISLPKLGHICLSPDGSSFDWMSEVGGALYHLPNMEQVGQFKGYFTRSGEFVGDYLALSLIQQARIQLWSLTTHEDVALFQEPEVATVQWTYAFCDSLMAVGVTHASVYRLRTPEKVAFPAHGAAVTGVAFSPDGARLASVDKNRILRVSDAARGQTLWEATNLPGPGQCVDFSPNGKWLVTGDYSTCLVEIWNAQTGQHLLELGTNTPGETTSTQFSPDGLYLATCNYGGSTNGICVYKRDEENTDADAPRFRLFKSLASEGVSLVFAPNSHSLAFAKGFDDGNLYVWNFDQSEAPDPLNSKFDISVQSIAFTPDSRRLLAQDWTQILTADPVTGKTITTFPLPGHRLGSSGQLLSLSPDGSCLAVSSATHLGVDLLDHVTGRMIYPLPEEYGTVYWLAWSPDSHRLAIARDDGSVAIWNLPVINETLAQLGLSP